MFPESIVPSLAYKWLLNITHPSLQDWNGDFEKCFWHRFYL